MAKKGAPVGNRNAAGPRGMRPSAPGQLMSVRLGVADHLPKNVLDASNAKMKGSGKYILGGAVGGALVGNGLADGMIKSSNGDSTTAAKFKAGAGAAIAAAAIGGAKVKSDRINNKFKTTNKEIAAHINTAVAKERALNNANVKRVVKG